jgi:hypothetical protein
MRGASVAGGLQDTIPWAGPTLAVRENGAAMCRRRCIDLQSQPLRGPDVNQARDAERPRAALL